MAGEASETAQPKPELVEEKRGEPETRQDDGTETQQQHHEERAPELPPRPLPAAHPDAKRASGPQPAFVRFSMPPAGEPIMPTPYGVSDPEGDGFKRPSNPRWDLAKIVLYVLSLIISGLIIGVGLWIGLLTAPYMVPYMNYGSEIEMGLSASAAGLAILFITLDMLRKCLSTGRRSMHPGILVTFNLFIWLVALVAVVITSFYAIVYDDEFDEYGLSDSEEGINLVKKTSRLEKALFGLDCVLLAIHFILFVGACVESSQRNQAKRKTVYITVPPVPGQPGPAYMYQPGQQQYTAVPMPPPAGGAQWRTPGTGVFNAPAAQPAQWGAPQAPPQVNNQYAGYYAPANPMPQQGFYTPYAPPSTLAVPKSALKSRQRVSAEAGSSSSSVGPTPPPKDTVEQKADEPVAEK
ncbi:hypothetical protein QBC42DRAFT_345160 [Cladorrhinum samala]|uniref:MARVEL domain-containing protein n=1 Tax=Cladorrhinum samala TaxID=585594 RepID=A0AAV9HV54_9PEZI|nr:hypothetical protein QBC42DRAFT_345160 [Cladorrhinum samala]